MERGMADNRSGKRDASSVKLHSDVVQSARVVAALRGVTITDLVSDMIRDELVKMEAAEIAKRAKPGGKSPK
jgi:hypothetical protein